jgi:exodeoxyribonuclease VII small subunit
MTSNTENSPPADRVQANPPAEAPPDFERALSELEQIVHQLESGSLGLEPSLARFEQGVSLLRHCYETLEKAEQRIELLTGFDAAGNPVTAPFPSGADVEVAIEVQETTVEVAPRQPPRKASVEKRVPEGDDGEELDSGPRLF